MLSNKTIAHLAVCLFRTSPDSSACEVAAVAAGAAGGSALLFLRLAHPSSFPFSPYPCCLSFSLLLSRLLSLPLTE